MPNDIKVRIVGMAELKRAFKHVDDELPKELKTRFGLIARAVVSKVQGKVPQVSGTAASSYVPRSTATGAGLAFGGTKAPYAPWLDFGGHVGRNRSVARPFIREGRYLYPTIKEMRPEIARAAEEAIITTAQEAEFETR